MKYDNVVVANRLSQLLLQTLPEETHKAKAQYLGVSETNLNNWIRGKCCTDMYHLRMLACRLIVTVSDLVSEYTTYIILIC